MFSVILSTVLFKCETDTLITELKQAEVQATESITKRWQYIMFIGSI